MAKPLIDDYERGRGILWGEPDVDVTSRLTLVGQDIYAETRRERIQGMNQRRLIRRAQDRKLLGQVAGHEEQRSMVVIGYMAAYGAGVLSLAVVLTVIGWVRRAVG